MMNIKNEVLVRVYVVLFVIVLAAVFIFAKAVRIGVIEGDEWRAMGDSLYISYRPVDAQRGNISTSDGSLLATSLPYFEIRMDLKSTGMSDEDFENNIDSLAWCLATYIDNSYTPGGMEYYLRQQREAGNRYLLIKNRASYADVELMKKFPLFNQGRYRGGFIVVQRSERKKPFGLLAHRTIGYVREGAYPVGLEGEFDKVLSGKKGQQLMQRVNADTWMPLDDLTDIEPQDGKDIRTTIDINIQDITESALLRAMQYHNAESGCAVVMEVKTGAIKGIANLGKTKHGFWETYNFAVGAPIEPGSTFKLASIMSLLENRSLSLEDSVDLEMGLTQFYEEEMRDASYHQLDTTSIRNAFEISSNVGIAKLIWQNYGAPSKADQFIDQLKAFNLHLPTGIEIEGEPNPYIKTAYSKEDHWSGTTLPWMSIGYELTMTPLQILNFYNAVANNGIMMKPYLVSEIQQFGETIQTYKPTVVKRRLASKRTIEKAKSLLEGVVQNGTAHLLQTKQYNFAGKTGTTQLNYQKLKARTKVGGYQASFVGYFPAENPVFSCIVVISNPKNYGIYGSVVAGPVFREIADKIFASRPEMHENISDLPKAKFAGNILPGFAAGYGPEMEKLAEALDMTYYDKAESATWKVMIPENDSLNFKARILSEKVIPSVIGMGLRDAVYILENMGLNVKVNGYGKVRRQSILAGTAARGQTIQLYLK